ncbi:DUF5985 family protein [Bdellovibrio sp. HCB185ZH]|uniref:DUF5985 family protein n=1 Tax=Bdellovibrio sp. HCB185ZH TaxID=3394235 RepID=UPI0039A6B7EB
MTTDLLKQFIYGAVMMASFTSGIFFLKFWRKTQDRFFMLFAAAFFMLGAERWFFTFLPNSDEENTWIFSMRLLAFLIIIGAVIDKNRE